MKGKGAKFQVFTTATNAITDNSFLGLLIILLLFWQISALDLEYTNVKFLFYKYSMLDHSSPNMVRVIKSRRMRWAGDVARMGEERGV